MKYIDLAEKFNKSTAGDIIGVKVENELRSLDETVKEGATYEFIDTSTLEGIRIYRDTLKFVLVKAVRDLFPEERLRIRYSVNKGAFCQIIGRTAGEDEIGRIKARMRYLVNGKFAIGKNEYDVEQAEKIVCRSGRKDLAAIFRMHPDRKVTLYSLGGVHDYFHGILAPHTGYVDIFDLKAIPNGFILLYPTRFNPGALPEWKEQKKLAGAFEEFRVWGEAIGVDTIGDLNEIVKKGELGEIIRISEALQEKKIGYIADEIKRDGKSFVFIAGPSSSGKTTFSKRLSIHLRAVGLKAHPISLDSYYKGSGIPVNINGDKDYEAPEALDIERFNSDMHSLQEQGFAQIPVYDFHTESRKGFRELVMEKEGVVIVEGIHGINPRFSVGVDRDKAHKLYISALTSVNLDDHNRLSTTDARLFRRIVRDFRYRGSSAERTLGMWNDVRRGEDRYIFPFQEEADEIFNSALIYEHNIIRKYAVPILEQVPEDSEFGYLAERLLGVLMFFVEADDSEIPNTSILREFIGGSVLDY